MNHISENIASKTFEHVYLLYGSEAYMRRRAANELCNAIVPATDTMNRMSFEGKDTQEGEIIDLGETLPLFSERRLIVVKNSGFFKGSSELLTDYMAAIPDYLTLVFSEDEVDKRSRLYRAVVKYGYAEEFKIQDEKTLIRWAARLMQQGGRKIRQGDAEYFIARTGRDMGRIALEVDKLTAYTEGREEITRGDIDALTGRETENKIFDMTAAVAAGDRKKALALYRDLLELREAPMRILILIERQFRQMLLTAGMLEEKAGNEEIARKLGVPSFVVRRYGGMVRHMKKENLQHAAELCLQFEEDIKNGRITDRLSVELLLISLTA